MTTVPTILIVEDNPTTRKMLRLVLVTEGFAVVEAGDARAALAAVELALPDLVLQDLILPDMDGLELLRRFRALPKGLELPILALSGFLSRLEEAQTDRAGFTALLVKPIEPSHLVDAIRVYLPQQPVREAPGGRGRRLLVVDDDPVQLKLTRLHFSHLGFDVTAVNGASDALTAARARPPDVILSDVFMPGTDGFDLCLEVRRDPTLANVPVVLLSGQYGSTADQDLARRVGASALVLRTPDFGSALPALLDAIETRAPVPAEQPSDHLALTHARLVIHQLERQVAAEAGLAQRCGIQAAQLSLLSGVADALTHKSDPDAALRDVLGATLDAAGISKGALIVKDASGVLQLRQDVGFSEAERSRLQGFFGHGELLKDIVDHGGSVSIPSSQMSDGPSRDILTGAGVSAAQIVPLISDGHGVGALIIGSTSTDVTSEDSVAFARAMGNQIVQSLELARSVGNLAASEKRYRTLLESANDFISVLTPAGVVQEMNHRWAELTGLSVEELIGRHVRDFAPAGKGDESAGSYDKAVSASASRTPPVEIASAAGPSVFIEFSTTQVDVGGEPLIFAIGRDVTDRQRMEAQLRLHGAALAAAANAIVITDRSGVIQWVNPAFSELTGYAAEEAIGRNPRDLVKSDQNDPTLYDDLWATLTSGQVWRGEIINRRKDGSLYPEDQIITPVRDASGEISHFIAIKQDISERRRADDEIRQRARVSALVASVGLTLGGRDALPRVLQRCAEALVEHLDAAFARIWTLDEKHAVLELQASAGMYTHLDGPHSRIPLGQFKIGRIAASRAPHLTSGVIGDPEVADQAWAEREGMVAFAGHPLIVDDRVVGVMALFARRPLADSTQTALASVAGHVALGIDRIRGTDALRASEARFARLAESGIVGVLIADVLGNILESNDAFLQMVGYSREELVSGAIRWADLTPPEFREVTDAALAQLQERGVAQAFEMETLRKDGSRLPILVGVAMLDYPNCIAFAADLSDRKKAEAALASAESQLRQAQKMEAVGRLAGGVAHDFNNLLSVILGFGEIVLAELKPGDPMRKDVEEVCKAGTRAADLTRQLLMFSRQQVLEPRVLDLNEVLRGMDRMLSRILGEDVELVALPFPSLGRVKLDPSSLEQIIMNLVVNARDAMPTGGKLTIETANVELDENYALHHLQALPGAYVALIVSDTGTGMSRETQARLFEPFFTTKEIGKGTGLGLSTVFGIVHQCGGSIWVYSELGQGTTFKIYLPRVDADLDVAGADVAPAALRGTETILLVEDEEQVRAIAIAILRRQGYRVLAAQNGGEALLLCEKHAGEIDLLLTDVVMPQMGGPELAKRLAPLRPEMKLLCMSGYTDDSIVRHGVLSGDIPFLQKPITSASLGRKVREVLDAPA